MKLRFCLCLLCCLFLEAAGAQGPLQIDVFTTFDLPVKPSKSHSSNLVVLDETKRVIEQLGRGLPNNQALAEKEIFKRLYSKSGIELTNRLEASATGLVKAWRHNVTKLPAIMIDEKYLLYGVYSVDRAVEIYRRQKQ